TVLRLVQVLRDRGISFRFDQDLKPGEPWDRQLGEWAKSADAILVVWSGESAVSSWVINEASEARDRLIPVTIGGMSVVPGPFRNLHTLDLSGWSGDPRDKGIDQLEQALRSRIARHPGPPGPPPGPASGPGTDAHRPDESRSGATAEGTEA